MTTNDLSPCGSDPRDARFLLRCHACGTAAYPEDRYCACCGCSIRGEPCRCGARTRHAVVRYCTQCGSPHALFEDARGDE